MTLSFVEHHSVFVLKWELIMSAQKKQHKAHPTLDLMQARVTQLTTIMLSHQTSNTGYGLSVNTVISITIRAPTYLMITDMNSKRLMLMILLLQWGMHKIVLW